MLWLANLMFAGCIQAESPRDLRDQDGDGYQAWEECDDLDAAVHPGAPEACNGLDDDCDLQIDEGEGTDWYADQDGDGWGSGEPVRACDPAAGLVNNDADCDDLDAARHPEAEERCDEVDQDCDDEADEQAVDGQTAWRDADGDGYGDPDVESTRCALGDGWVDNALDCQDADADAHPGGQERCDEADADQDCDGLVDDADPDAVGQGPVYLDADGDGWGDAERSLDLCDAPGGYASNAEDCDDDDPTIGAPERCLPDVDGDGWGDGTRLLEACPGAPGTSSSEGDCDDGDPARNPDASETWYDGVDQDCDARSDFDQDRDGHDADTWGGQDCDDTDATRNPDVSEVWYDGVDQDCDGWSDFDQDQDGVAAESAGGEDCDDEAPSTWPGSPTLGYPGDWDCDGAVDLLVQTWSDEGLAWSELGSSLAGAGDLDGDGLEDLALGAPGDDGAVFVLLGPVSAYESVEAATATIGSTDFERLGQRLTGAADTDGDGYDDLAISSRNGPDARAGHGVVVLLEGPLVGALDPGGASTLVTGESATDDLGRGLATADLDGDGAREIVAGAPGLDASPWTGGAVFVLSPGSTGEAPDVDTAALWGAASDDVEGLGYTLARAGDLDGDGLEDLAVGEPHRSALPGRVWAVCGPLSGSLEIADVGVPILGLNNNDEAGAGLDGGTDENGDGYADLLVGAPARGVSGMVEAGTAWLFHGPIDAELSGADYDARFRGDEADLRLGESVAFLGDVDGDGEADVGVSAPSASALGAAGGEVLVYLGAQGGSRERSEADVRLLGEAGDGLGQALAGPGDLDGDGLGELVAGAPAASEGQVLLMRGGF